MQTRRTTGSHRRPLRPGRRVLMLLTPALLAGLLAAPVGLRGQEDQPPGDTLQEREDTLREPAAAAQPQEPPFGEAAQGPQAMIERLLARMHRGNEMEIRLGQLAKQKGQWAKVRAYGDRIARDHRMGDRMVLGIAEDRQLALAGAAETGEGLEEPRVGVGGERPTPEEYVPAAQREEEAEPERAEAEAGEPAEKREAARTDTSVPAPEDTTPPDTTPPGAEAGGPPAAGEPPADAQEIARRLETASPEEFDRMYLEAMVTLHDETIGQLLMARQRIEDRLTRAESRPEEEPEGLPLEGGPAEGQPPEAAQPEEVPPEQVPPEEVRPEEVPPEEVRPEEQPPEGVQAPEEERAEEPEERAEEPGEYVEARAEAAPEPALTAEAMETARTARGLLDDLIPILEQHRDLALALLEKLDERRMSEQELERAEPEPPEAVPERQPEGG